MRFPTKEKVVEDGYFFSKDVCEKLKYYVYAYYDSKDNGVPFYIGKGKGNRCFQHLYDKESTNGLKVEKIKEIYCRNEYPTIEILRHGMESEQEALTAEALAIDLIGKENLTNLQSGHGAKKFGRHGIDVIKEKLSDNKEIDISDLPKNSLIIKIQKSYKEGMSLQELYDITRSCWRINPNDKEIKYVFSVYNGVIKQVFIPVVWIPGNSTIREFTKVTDVQKIDPDRWEFVGRVAHEKQNLIGKRITLTRGAQNPCCYTVFE
ncbi:LEM-3-like GIY-YIG domain-containing protein [Mailhella massiliensis]|uniref:LEM-3-like GIY-YIG domain-containing protein n=1 Tax=Mailhella massiliensis TaxID=1903261 RepID=UPI001184EA0E|nr:hypothetical protein [Mailhella massiliensis]